jgi:hypothetical protein
MSEPLMILLSTFVIVAIYVLYECLRMTSFLKWIERPLTKHYKDWDNNVPQLQKRLRNKNYQRDYYAYRSLSADELKGIRIILKSYESEPSFFQVLLEWLWKISLPVIAIKVAMGDTQYTVYSFTNESLEWLAALAGTFAVVVLLQILFKNKRKQWIHYHVLLIDQVLVDPIGKDADSNDMEPRSS